MSAPAEQSISFRFSPGKIETGKAAQIKKVFGKCEEEDIKFPACVANTPLLLLKVKKGGGKIC